MGVRTELVVQQLSFLRKHVPVFEPLNADGHFFQNDGSVFLEIKNTDAGSTSVSFVIPRQGPVNGFTNVSVTIPQLTGDKHIGPFAPQSFNQRDGKGEIVHMNVGSGVANRTIAAFRM